jgi:dATP pyrophosphohydrolase
VYALFKRKQEGYWQGIAGGGEAEETPLDAARREGYEEAGIPLDADYVPLDARTMIPVVNIFGFLWGPEVLVVPEYAFAVRTDPSTIRISQEHSSFAWMPYQQAHEALHWDSNRTALWELNERATRGKSDRRDIASRRD